jgi:hypothetical protein
MAAPSSVLGATGRPSSAAARPNRHELEAQYSGLPGLHKRVAAATHTKSFKFTERGSEAHGKKTRESKVWQMVVEKREAEERECAVKFKAQPVAPTVHDLGLFAAITARNEARRAKEHALKAAYAAAHFRPFTIVTAHCEEHAARQAARRAKQELELQRELRDVAKFTANGVPASTSRADGMFFAILQREKEKKGRVAAAAHALAATAALPPRMAARFEEDARRAAERAAQLAEAERKDKQAHAFHAVPLPDFKAKAEAFKRSCDEARVAVTSSFKAARSVEYGFDRPEQLARDAAKKDAFIKEFELSTSRSMDLRKRSKAYAEGQDLVGEPARSRARSAGPASSRPGLKGTLGVNPLLEAGGLLNSSLRAASAQGRRQAAGGPLPSAPLASTLASSSAPPAAMTKSVKLKMLEVQRRLRDMQQKELDAELADEAFEAECKLATSRFKPLFNELEYQRGLQRLQMAHDNQKMLDRTEPEPLSWQMDHVTASASEAAREFVARSRETAAKVRNCVKKGQSDRPLVMLSSTLQAEKENARRDALVKAAKAMASGASSHKRRVSALEVATHGVGGVQLFHAAEKEILTAKASL